MAKNEQFGQRLSQGINSVANRQFKNKGKVEEDIAELLGCGHFNVKRWQRGYVPDDPQRVSFLVEYCVKYGFVGRSWAESFLHHASYYGKEKLLASLFAEQPTIRSSGQALIYQNLPSIYGDFVGREEALQRVVEGLLSRWPLVSIEGMAGIGKTTLAIVVGRACLPGGDARLDEPFEACIFISAKDTVLTLNTFLDKVAYELNYPRISQQPFSAAKPAEVQKLLRQYRVLLIADNLETVTDQSLISFLRGVPEPSKVLITTRWPQVRGTWDVSLEGLAQEDALRLIRQHARRLQLENLMQAAGEALKDLVMVTGGNPYAIEMALGHLRYNKSLTTERQENAVKKLVNALYAADRELDDLFDRMFKWAWEDDVLNAEARCLLLATPFFVDSATAEALGAAAGVEGYYLTKALRQLGEMSLLKENAAGRYSVHPLTRAFAARKLREAPDWETGGRKRWLDYWLRFAQSYGGEDWDNWQEYAVASPEVPNLLLACNWAFAQNVSEIYFELSEKITELLFVTGLWKEYVLLANQSIELARKLNDPERCCMWLKDCGWALTWQDEFSEAMIRLKEAVEIAEELADQELLAKSIHNLGILYHRQGDYEVGRKIIFQALAIATEKETEREILAGWYHLGCIAFEQNEFDEAEGWFGKVKAFGHELNWARAHAYARNWLADIEIVRGNYKQARTLLAEGYPVAENFRDQRRIAFFKNSYAHLEQAEGNMAMARTYAHEALDLFSRLGMKKEERELREFLGGLET
ncbi:MAG: hypothetical protein Fur0021_12040 [Candidatus Promineifilaceae bacterium]